MPIRSIIDASTSTIDEEFHRFVGSDPNGTRVFVEVIYFPNHGGPNEYDFSIANAVQGDVGATICGGVPNSTAVGSKIDGSGSPVVADNDLVVNASDLPSKAFGFFSTSMAYGVNVNPGGSLGVLCLGGGPVGRYVGPGQILNSGALGSVSLAIDWSNMPVASTPVAQAGESWYFQFWHRDVVGGAAVSSFGAALRVRTEWRQGKDRP